jgi:ElaA protein
VRQWHWRKFHELSPDELYEILSLRAMVFVVEQDCAYLDLDGADRRAQHLFSLGPDGRAESYLRVLGPGERYDEPYIGRVVSHPDVRRTGVGMELMREGIRRIEESFSGSAIRLNAQRRLQAFYEKFGFVPIGEPYDEDGIEHIQMIRPPLTSSHPPRDFEKTARPSR